MNKDVTLESALMNITKDPREPAYNFVLAQQYEQIGQTSSATSYYLRAAEFAPYTLIAYEAMLKLSQCFEHQGDRWYHVRTTLLRAISMQPQRPEAYFLLAKAYETTKEWSECHTFCKIAEVMIKEDHPPLRKSVGYPGIYFFTYQRAIAGFELGLIDEAIHIMFSLYKRTDLSKEYAAGVWNSLLKIGRSFRHAIPYLAEYYEKLRFKFIGAERVDRNYSQAYQDMFVLTMLNGKREGTFLEIGCDHATSNSNTYLLETEFGWSGISIDIDPQKIEQFSQKRTALSVVADATKMDYTTLLTEQDYDYLQVDCEPPAQTLEALRRVPLHKHRFAVITFEHDAYTTKEDVVRELSRKYLQSYGYVLVVNDIAEDRWSNFEDWWVHPALVDPHILNMMSCVDDKTKKADLYMFNKL